MAKRYRDMSRAERAEVGAEIGGLLVWLGLIGALAWQAFGWGWPP